MTKLTAHEDTPLIPITPYLHEPSDTVRFQVQASGTLINASVNRQALRNSFRSGDPNASLLSVYDLHFSKIHEAVLRRLAQGAWAPVMLRESNFPPL